MQHSYTHYLIIVGTISKVLNLKSALSGKFPPCPLVISIQKLTCHHTMFSLLSYFQSFSHLHFPCYDLCSPISKPYSWVPRFFNLPSPLLYMLSQLLALAKPHLSLTLLISLRCDWEELLNILKQSTAILGFPVWTGSLSLLSNNYLVTLFLPSLHWSFFLLLYLWPIFWRNQVGSKIGVLRIVPSSEPTIFPTCATGMEVNMAVILTYIFYLLLLSTPDPVDEGGRGEWKS